jgi:hypothetical protein
MLVDCGHQTSLIVGQDALERGAVADRPTRVDLVGAQRVFRAQWGSDRVSMALGPSPAGTLAKRRLRRS